MAHESQKYKKDAAQMTNRSEQDPSLSSIVAAEGFGGNESAKKLMVAMLKRKGSSHK